MARALFASMLLASSAVGAPADEPQAKLPPRQQVVEVFEKESFVFDKSLQAKSGERLFGHSKQGGMQLIVLGSDNEPQMYQCSLLPTRKDAEDVPQLARWRILFFKTVLPHLTTDELTAFDKWATAGVEDSKKHGGREFIGDRYGVQLTVFGIPDLGYDVFIIEKPGTLAAVKELEGTWAVEAATFNGKSTDMAGGEVMIAGETFTLKPGKGDEQQLLFKLDVATVPGGISLIFAEAEPKHATLGRAIYELTKAR